MLVVGVAVGVVGGGSLAVGVGVGVTVVDGGGGGVVVLLGDGVVVVGGGVLVVGDGVPVGTVVGGVVGTRVGFGVATVVSATVLPPLGRDREACDGGSARGGNGAAPAGAEMMGAVVLVVAPVIGPSRDVAPGRPGRPAPDSSSTPETAASAEPPITMAAVAPPMIMGGRRYIGRSSRCLPMYRIASPLADRVRLVRRVRNPRTPPGRYRVET